MKTTRILYSLLLTGAMMFVISGCSKERKEDLKPEVANPTFQNFVIGDGNSKTVKLGENFIVEADIIAPGKISRVQIVAITLEAEIPRTISSNLEGDYVDKTKAHLSWNMSTEDLPTGKYRITITVAAKMGEPGQISADFTIVP